MCTAHGGGGDLANLKNPELFAKIFLAIIHRYTENVFGMCTHCNLFANSSPIPLTCMVHQNFSLSKFFRVRCLYLYLILLKVLAFYLSTSPKTMPCTCTWSNVKVLVLYLSTFTCTSPHAWPWYNHFTMQGEKLAI